jgi:hypothetical protein
MVNPNPMREMMELVGEGRVVTYSRHLTAARPYGRKEAVNTWTMPATTRHFIQWVDDRGVLHTLRWDEEHEDGLPLGNRDTGGPEER